MKMILYVLSGGPVESVIILLMEWLEMFSFTFNVFDKWFDTCGESDLL